MTRYIAHFSPEAWQGDQAIEVDAEGEREWDCTDFVNQDGNLAYLTGDHCRHGGDLNDEFGVLDNDDVFQNDPAAPEWVREWRGPFTLRVRAVHDWLTTDTLLRSAYTLLGDGAGNEWRDNPEYTPRPHPTGRSLT